MSTTALQIQQKQALKQLETTLIGFKEKLKAALPPGRNVDQEISSVLATVASSPTLQKCTPQSIAMAAYNAATVGLPVSVLGLAYLVPYGNEAKFQIGYKGQLHLLYETGFVASVDAEVVYENDKFKFSLGSKPSIEHEPCFGPRGKITYAYAVAHLTNGISKQVVLSKEEIDRIRQSSKSGNSPSSPWATHYPEMAKKTAIRRLSKYLPQYVPGLQRIQAAVEVEEKQFEPLEHTHSAAPATEPSYSQEPTEPEDVIEAEVEDIPPAEKTIELDQHQQLISQIRDLQVAIKEKDKKAELLPKDLEDLPIEELKILYGRKQKHWDLCNK